MDSLFMILGWGSAIGIGVFLALLGIFIWLLAKADEVKARTNALKKEKGLDTKWSK